MESTFILIAAAVVPALILMIRIYRRDQVEKEPVSLLLGLVFAGILATFAAVLLEQAGIYLLNHAFSSENLLYQLLLYFVVVAGSEEGAKYMLLKRRTWNHPAFNCLFDGVVYSTFVSLGFALWENISYVLMYGMQTALLRAVTAIPGHACFGVFMGVWYSLARQAENQGDTAQSSHFRKSAFFVPALLHGLYDFLATYGHPLLFIAFILFVIGMFIAALVFIRRASQNDSYIAGPPSDLDWSDQ